MKNQLSGSCLVLVFQAVALGQTASSTSLIASPNSSDYGQSVTLTATVTQGATGKVTFYDGVTILGIGTLSGAQASISTVMLSSGNRKLRAYYQGDGTYAPSSSALVAQSVVAGASLGLRPPLNIPSAHQSEAAAVGDFNGDGRQDLAIASWADNCVTIYLGNGNGTFQSGVDYAVGMSPHSVAIGDFNEDGRMDLAVANYSYSISILMGNGDGTFQPAANYQLQELPLSIAVADFNGDGKADLVVMAESGDVVVLLGNGDGTFQSATSFPAVGFIYFYAPALAIGDFNGDGYPDLAVTNVEGTVVLLGNGDGTFQAARNVAGDDQGGAGIIAPDLNNDGRADLFAYGDGYYSYMLFGNGDGTFTVSSLLTMSPPPFETSPADALVADFNGDGKPDLALLFYLCCTPVSSYVQLLPGNGDGTFGSAVNYHLNTGFNLAVVGDFDGDGTADLVLASYDNTGFSVMLGGALPDLTIAATHGIGFTQGQQTATYTITVSNPGAYASSGAVGMVASLPSGLTATTIGGTGWTCVLPTLACTRDDVLAVGASYPAIDLQVSFANGLTGYVTSTFTVSGGGESNVSNDVFTDTTFMRFPTTVGLTASPNPSVLGQAVTLIASVTAGATGHVDFYDGFLPIGSAPVAAGQSTFTTSSLAPGIRTLRAAYSGDSTYGPSESSARIQTVNPVAANGAQPYSSYTVDTGPEWVVAGDLNGDGKPDLVTANNGSNNVGTVSVLMNNGDGTFRKAVNYPIAGGPYPTSAVIGDFNNDGKPDVAVAGNNGIAVLAGNGDGTLAAAQVMESSTSYTYLAAADFNGDGNLDLVVLGSGAILIFFGNGDGTFQSPVSVSGPGDSYSDLAVADMNGDGKPDLIGQNGLQLSVLLGNGDGTFQAPKTVPAVSNGIRSSGALVVGDFNGDGRPDVALVCLEAVEVLPGNGDGTFGNPIVTPIDTDAAAFAIAADFNGDGKLDIAYSTDPFDDTVDFVFGNGDGTFQSGPSFVTGSFNSPGVTRIAVGDFNGDGRLDFAVTSDELGTVYVFLAGQFPSVTVSSSHTGTFTAGKTGSYSVNLSTNTFAGVTGEVSVTDILPPGLTATAISGNNWNCVVATLTCTSYPSLGTGSSASPIALTVSVAPSMATGIVNNQVKVTYNGVTYSATDPTTIVAPSTTSLTVSPNPVTLGQPVAITATLTAGATGAVLFLDNGVPVGIAIAVNGVATLNTRLLPSGVQSLMGVYAGNSAYGPSTSPAIYETVQASPANGFALPVTYPTAVGPAGIAMGDFNLDGKPDLVTVNEANTVSVLLGNGDGTFAPRVDYPVPPGATFVVVADFNNDAVPDLAVATASGVSVLLGRGDGSFLPAINTPVGLLNFLAVSDFNADGKADLIAFGQGSAILLGNGDGTFQPYSALGIVPAYDGVAGDFNRDGKIDFLTSSGSLLLGNGDGTFQSSTIPGLISNNTIAAGDMNGDGKLDVVTFADVYLGNGDGTFRTPIPYTAPTSLVVSMSTVDVNGDGKLDVVTTNYPSVTGVNLGKGDGTLQSPSVVLQSVGTPHVVAGDFNGDGITDLAITDETSDTVTILLGAGVGPVLTFTDTHSDPFYLGQTGATYTITVTNNGPGAAVAPITAAVFLASGLTAAGLAGNGWNCTLASVSCTNPNPLAAGASYAPITLTVTVTATSVGPLGHQVTVTGSGDIPATGSFTTQVVGTLVTLQTIPGGLEVQFAGQNPQVAPASMNIAPGTTLISAPATQTTTGTQYLFSSWSDGGPQSHYITVGTTPATCTATFQTQYQLTTATYPQSGGTVTPTAFYSSGTPVTLTATPNAPLVFTGWSNGATSNPLQLSMNAPVSITAYFDIPGATCTMTGDANASISDVQYIVNEALGIVAANNDLNNDGVVNIADVQRVANAAMNLGCH